MGGKNSKTEDLKTIENTEEEPKYKKTCVSSIKHCEHRLVCESGRLSTSKRGRISQSSN